MPHTSPSAGYTEGYRALGDDLRALAAPGDALTQLAGRLRVAASVVGDQAPHLVRLLSLDWHGPAARAFGVEVAGRLAALDRLAARLDEVADGAARRAAAGDALRSVAGWTS